MVLAIEEARVPCIEVTARAHRCARQSDEDASPNRDGQSVADSATLSGRVSGWTGWHACCVSHGLQCLVTVSEYWVWSTSVLSVVYMDTGVVYMSMGVVCIPGRLASLPRLSPGCLNVFA